jgi:hypothetical protein
MSPVRESIAGDVKNNTVPYGADDEESIICKRRPYFKERPAIVDTNPSDVILRIAMPPWS